MKLIAKNLKKTYRNRTVVNDVSLEVNQGEIIGLLGPNGAGKTTSFYMIVGLVQANGGEVFLDDMNITQFDTFHSSFDGSNSNSLFITLNAYTFGIANDGDDSFCSNVSSS